MQKRSIRSRSYRPRNTQNKHDMGIKDGIDVAKFMGIPSVVIRSAVWVMLGIIVGGYSTYVIVVAHIEREQYKKNAKEMMDILMEIKDGRQRETESVITLGDAVTDMSFALKKTTDVTVSAIDDLIPDSSPSQRVFNEQKKQITEVQEEKLPHLNGKIGYRKIEPKNDNK